MSDTTSFADLSAELADTIKHFAPHVVEAQSMPRRRTSRPALALVEGVFAVDEVEPQKRTSSRSARCPRGSGPRSIAASGGRPACPRGSGFPARQDPQGEVGVLPPAGESEPVHPNPPTASRSPRGRRVAGVVIRAGLPCFRRNGRVKVGARSS